MASKMIAIKEEIYNKLIKLKKGNQSFSELIEDILSKMQKNPLSHFGIGKNLNKEDLDDFEQILMKNRELNRKNIRSKLNSEILK